MKNIHHPISIKSSSLLKNKRFFFLGSSVTYGSGSSGVGIPELIDEYYGCKSIKEAVSGTTLADINDESYVSRFEKYIINHPDESFDMIIVQLSTNDSHLKREERGDISNDLRFNKKTTYGAMEYIVYLAKEKHHCPIMFYTNHNYDSPIYGVMVDTAHKICDKWNISLLDLYHDEEINCLSEEEKAMFLVDNIHPTISGYCDWWLPKFVNFMGDLLEKRK